MALLSFAVFGFVLDDPVVLRDVQRYLAENLPRVDVLALRNARGTVGVIGFVLSVGVNTLLSIAVLPGLPRLRMPLRRPLGPALFVADGLELLKTLGRIYVRRTGTNATYLVVAGAVGLLDFLNAINQLIQFAATLAATSTAGEVTDLAAHSTDAAPPP